MYRWFGAFVLSAALLAPVTVVSARADDDDEHHERHYKRYYDPDARDYHEWNEREQRAYRHWYTNQYPSQSYYDWDRVNNERRREYWRWRHRHMEEDFPERTEMPRRTQ